MPKLEMFPPDPDYIRIHTRRYEVRAFRKADDCLMLRGVVVDEKPVGLYIESDPDPLWMHHMILDLEIHFPTLVIQKANVQFNEHPHLGCTGIVDHYKKLEGMSITRGFNAKVKELFAGPRGCTHTTALLQAMAPVAVQPPIILMVISKAAVAAQVNVMMALLVYIPILVLVGLVTAAPPAAVGPVIYITIMEIQGNQQQCLERAEAVAAAVKQVIVNTPVVVAVAAVAAIRFLQILEMLAILLVLQRQIMFLLLLEVHIQFLLVFRHQQLLRDK